MNFFGHALIASWHSAAPAFALGAMLPDLAAMCGAPVPRANHPEIAAGIEIHHATDRAFHRLPGFCAAVRATERSLAARGLGRGPAAGAAHVAFELCLDGVLLDEPGAVDHYLAAIEWARTELDGALEWTPPERQTRWRALVARLGEHGAPLDYRDGDLVADRVARALSRRPLLALDGAALAELRCEMPAIAGAAAAAAGEILAELRRELLGA